jgi:hypothetical protein
LTDSGALDCSRDYQATIPQPRSSSANSTVATIDTTIEPAHPNLFEYTPII